MAAAVTGAPQVPAHTLQGGNLPPNPVDPTMVAVMATITVAQTAAAAVAAAVAVNPREGEPAIGGRFIAVDEARKTVESAEKTVKVVEATLPVTTGENIRNKLTKAKEHTKEGAREQWTNGFKFAEHGFLISNEVSPSSTMTTAADAFKFGRHTFALIQLPATIIEFLELVAKWIVNGAHNDYFAAADIVSKLSEIGNKVCDGMCALASKTAGLVKLTPEQAKIFGKSNMFFLGISSVLGIALKSYEIYKCVEVWRDPTTTPDDKKELKKRMIHCAAVIVQWLAYASLASLVLYGLFSGIWVPKYATLTCSGTALSFSIIAYVYENYSGLKGLKKRSDLANRIDVFCRTSKRQQNARIAAAAA